MSHIKTIFLLLDASVAGGSLRSNACGVGSGSETWQVPLITGATEMRKP